MKESEISILSSARIFQIACILYEDNFLGHSTPCGLDETHQYLRASLLHVNTQLKHRPTGFRKSARLYFSSVADRRKYTWKLMCL
jgi:hypothetical protein